jgi:predicted dinucleotide-binding enzyme
MSQAKICSRFRPICLRLLLFAFGLAGSVSGSADTIAVIGTGDVAQALGPEFASLGHRIVYGSRNPAEDRFDELIEKTGQGTTVLRPAEAAVGADIVVLAVPGMVVESVTRSLGDLSGKIIIDPTNPLERDEEGLFVHGVTTSNAEIIQAAAPEAFVVKAFNALNWRTMVEPETASGPVTIPLVGDSDAAKATVAALVSGIGLEPIDLGPLRHARYVEGMLILWINNRYAGGEPFDYYLRKVSKD